MIGLHDTCGINNLHGMPGILGGLSGAVAAALANRADYGSDLGLIFPQMETDASWTASQQGGHQCLATVVTMALAIVFGLLTGRLVACDWFCPPQVLFDDAEYWECGTEEDPEPVAGKV